MEAGVLFSGGKDSALAAIMLARDYGVELNTCVFDPDREVPGVRAAAAAPVRGLSTASGAGSLIQLIPGDGLLKQPLGLTVRSGSRRLRRPFPNPAEDSR